MKWTMLYKAYRKARRWWRRHGWLTMLGVFVVVLMIAFQVLLVEQQHAHGDF